jgi:integration host factor subunit beta
MQTEKPKRQRKAAKAVTKKELARRIAETTDTPCYTVKEIIQHFMDEIIAELAQGNTLEFREFGVFQPRTRDPRTARNPRTGAAVQIGSTSKVHFKPGRLMKKRVADAAK